jgi:hypothetical protein
MTYKKSKALSNRLMPIGFSPTINLTKIPRVPLKKQVQNETKALTKTKTLGES